MTGGNGSGDLLVFTRPPARVISLVPSMTETLFDLGLGGVVAGVTDYCRPPEPRPQVGGTKEPELARILDLAPDLVIANREENSRPSIEALQAAGVRVWATFPRSVQDSIQVLWTLVELFRSQPAAARVTTLEVTLDWALRAAQADRPVAVFAPIWQDLHPSAGRWWMTFNQETYAHSVLTACGGRNVFAERRRAYPLEADLGLAAAESPGERDVRYPRVRLDDVLGAMPEVILLPDEPYAFTEQDAAQIADELRQTPAAQKGRIRRIPGSLLSWHGTHLARSLAELPSTLRFDEAPGSESGVLP